MSRKYTVPLFWITLVVPSIAHSQVSSCKNFDRTWYEVERAKLGFSSPIIELSYKNGVLLRGARRVIFYNLKRAALLKPHPRVLVTLKQGECSKALNIVRQIELTGICRGSGCLYQFNK